MESKSNDADHADCDDMRRCPRGLSHGKTASKKKHGRGGG